MGIGTFPNPSAKNVKDSREWPPLAWSQSENSTRFRTCPHKGGWTSRTCRRQRQPWGRAAVCSNLCNEWVAVECGAPTGWPNGLAVNILFFLFPRRDRAVEFLKQGQI